MYFSRVFILLSAASLASVVFGAPVALSSSDESSLVSRDESDYLSDLASRALTAQQRGQRAAATIQKQQNRKAAKATRAPANKAAAVRQKQAAVTRKTAAKAAGQKKPTKLTPAQVKANKLARNPAKAQRGRNHAAAAARKNTPAGKNAKAAKKTKQIANRAARRKAGAPKGPAGVQGARKARVANRQAAVNTRKAAKNAERARLMKANPKMAKPARKAAIKAKVGPPTHMRPQHPDRIDVKNHLKASAQKMQSMTNIPNRNKVFSRPGSPETRTGKDVRKAVMNSHLHTAAPVGGANLPGGKVIKPMPKHFGNRNNAPGAPAPLPGLPQGGRSGMSEYPVLQGGAGWHGNGARPGAVRVLTDNRNNVFQGVVSHPPLGSANGGDYHKMN